MDPGKVCYGKRQRGDEFVYSPYLTDDELTKGSWHFHYIKLIENYKLN